MTEYTQIVAENDNVSFKDFALRCARNFGALIDMRGEPLDTPIPEKLEPSDYYVKQLELAKKEYDEYVKNLTTEDALEHQYELYVIETKENIERENKKRETIRKRYEAMLSKAKAWQPPTSEHYSLQEFMITQILKSIDWDCDVYEEKIMTKDEFIRFQKNRLMNKVKYLEEKVKGEQERYASCNKWIDDLRKSLEGID